MSLDRWEGDVTAEPLENNPLDPEDILRRLPQDERERFIRDYRSALDAAHELWRYQQLQDVLRLWHLRATAYASPDFAQRAEQARSGDPSAFVPASEAIPGWAERTDGAR
ncbi:hypothetical protein Acsp03_23050 [Actinomadura sp. NBRC 104412]|uniref:DUF6247 family protein n=1 Tax=Actinomadura sp. NBRC 104412 TaxID=3032203 RepID=UPI0024A4C7F7|nr:DUF6247 family protein [Actinomadura sp. NBRC 104412]GLZ04839.1 hypothetical protein Acsp03_23050 [Actinomadura sp. NBRC 104412]